MLPLGLLDHAQRASSNCGKARGLAPGESTSLEAEFAGLSDHFRGLRVFSPRGGANAIAGCWPTCEDRSGWGQGRLQITCLDAQELLRQLMEPAGPVAVH